MSNASMETTDFTSDANWLPKPVNYRNEAPRIALARISAALHPLGPVVSDKSCDKESFGIRVDTESQSPLTSPISPRFDPLSTPPPLVNGILRSSSKHETENFRRNSQSMLRDVPEKAAVRPPWQLKKDQILATFAIPVTDITDSKNSSQELDKRTLSLATDNRYDKYSQRLALLGRKSTSSGKEIANSLNDSYPRRIEVRGLETL
jgi:hypothetical protein